MNTNSIFISGAASGIGLAAAQHFHKMGYVVAMADLDFTLLEDVTEQWNKAQISLYLLDVSDFSQVQQVISEFCRGNNNSKNNSKKNVKSNGKSTIVNMSSASSDYGLLHFLSTVSPAYINRLVMKFLSR
jgi:NADPH:quinone reductase-like Zn-dependent oxidoreductase